jgi:hypothetical protein
MAAICRTFVEDVAGDVAPMNHASLPGCIGNLGEPDTGIIGELRAGKMNNAADPVEQTVHETSPVEDRSGLAPVDTCPRTIANSRSLRAPEFQTQIRSIIAVYLSGIYV